MPLWRAYDTIFYIDRDTMLFDDGGLGGEYSPDFFSSTVFRPPAGSDSSVYLRFVSFKLDGYCGDTLTVYNGEGITKNKLGVWTGTSGPAARILSTATDGSLTVVFKSNAYVESAGWAAHVGVVAKNSTPSIRNVASLLPTAFSVSHVNGIIKFAVPASCNGAAVNMSLYALNGTCVWHNEMPSVEQGIRRVGLPGSLVTGLYVLKMSAGTWNGTIRLLVR